MPGAPDPEAELVDFARSYSTTSTRRGPGSSTASGRYTTGCRAGAVPPAWTPAAATPRRRSAPFYCPPTAPRYLDLGFFRDLNDRFGAPGDFAQAYVIAHELGHHVQNLLGISDDVSRAQDADPDQANELSVRLELQADCFAGVWGHSVYNRGVLEDGDLQEGPRAAAAVGDDRIQASAGVDVDPETWTHGSAEQRQEWFNRGFDSGDLNACDTFS